MYFSYDPNGDGFVIHDTESQAEKIVKAAFEAEKTEAISNNEWMDNVENICFGKIIKKVVKSNININDIEVDYKLVSVK